MTAPVRRWAVVPAAGRGERFGGRTPKQYAVLSGRAILSWTLGALLAERSVNGIMVAIAGGDRRWKRLPEANDPRVQSCLGGGRREQSVALALQALEPIARESDWVLVHDAARPCLSRGDLRRLIREVGNDSVGGLLALPVSDTLKRDDGQGRCSGTIARDSVWRALTPQMFRYGLLRRALSLCLERQRSVTDEASAVETLGLRPILVRGQAENLKVTDPQDAALAAAILRGRESGR